MKRYVRSNLRAIVAMCRKDLQLALVRWPFTIVGIGVPINFLFLFTLFALSGGQAPTAVVMDDHGPLAKQFVSAMAHAHSFRLT